MRRRKLNFEEQQYNPKENESLHAILIKAEKLAIEVKDRFENLIQESTKLNILSHIYASGFEGLTCSLGFFENLCAYISELHLEEGMPQFLDSYLRSQAAASNCGDEMERPDPSTPIQLSQLTPVHAHRLEEKKREIQGKFSSLEKELQDSSEELSKYPTESGFLLFRINDAIKTVISTEEGFVNLSPRDARLKQLYRDLLQTSEKLKRELYKENGIFDSIRKKTKLWQHGNKKLFEIAAFFERYIINLNKLYPGCDKSPHFSKLQEVKTQFSDLKTKAEIILEFMGNSLGLDDYYKVTTNRLQEKISFLQNYTWDKLEALAREDREPQHFLSELTNDVLELQVLLSLLRAHNKHRAMRSPVIKLKRGFSVLSKLIKFYIHIYEQWRHFESRCKTLAELDTFIHRFSEDEKTLNEIQEKANKFDPETPLCPDIFSVLLATVANFKKAQTTLLVKFTRLFDEEINQKLETLTPLDDFVLAFLKSDPSWRFSLERPPVETKLDNMIKSIKRHIKLIRLTIGNQAPQDPSLNTANWEWRIKALKGSRDYYQKLMNLPIIEDNPVCKNLAVIIEEHQTCAQKFETEFHSEISFTETQTLMAEFVQHSLRLTNALEIVQNRALFTESHREFFRDYFAALDEQSKTWLENLDEQVAKLSPLQAQDSHGYADNPSLIYLERQKRLKTVARDFQTNPQEETQETSFFL